ncbi:MAG: hypothetical protein JNL74_11355 [Fibrobacteres bacterium]|nr:hypothetical protein [Fibrobacterota bacterium]
MQIQPLFSGKINMKLPSELITPPSEYSVMPFWFWNDALDENEIIRQIADFQKHGVHGFVIHPRVGLPRTIQFMSDGMLNFMEMAVREAQKRGMKVVLYDEGIYPSGSASGQVVASNPVFAGRCLEKAELKGNEEPLLETDEKLVAIVKRKNGTRIAIIDRKADNVIRGLHYIDEAGESEDNPPAADLLNPAAVDCFIKCVHEKFAARFATYFGNTVIAIFTDEPSPLSRAAREGAISGTTGILEHVNRILGYDFTPHLPALWYDDEPDAEKYRSDYHRAVTLRFDETYYKPLYDWCEKHGIALAGHPHKPDDLGSLRYFHVPGQDTVWRWVLPDTPSALEGAESVQAKCASSAMIHNNRRRNANECCGAYGHELTWEEMNWLAAWCFVRGTNLLHPHAFYYSIRGPRRDERPPDVGPNSPWWNRYKEYADSCARLSWLNTDSQHVCQVAILGLSNFLPWKAAKVCFQSQIDFNYLEERDLLDRAIIDDNGIHVGAMTYRLLITEHKTGSPAVMSVLKKLEEKRRLLHFNKTTVENEFISNIRKTVVPDFQISPANKALRVRHVIKNNMNVFFLFNEEKEPFDIMLTLKNNQSSVLVDIVTGNHTDINLSKPLRFKAHEMKLLLTSNLTL